MNHHGIFIIESYYKDSDPSWTWTPGLLITAGAFNPFSQSWLISFVRIVAIFCSI